MKCDGCGLERDLAHHCLTALKAKVLQLSLQNDELIEKCAQLTESEPWPEGPAPAEVLETSNGLPYEQIVEAAVKATRESIAEKIRTLVLKRVGQSPKDTCENYRDADGVLHPRFCSEFERNPHPAHSPTCQFYK